MDDHLRELDWRLGARGICGESDPTGCEHR
jgi:hypothetical protein